MIDKNKTYRTRDGREVRIYATDGVGTLPIHGAVKEKGAGADWHIFLWLVDGRATGGQDIADLIEVKPRFRIERWVNVFPDHLSPKYMSRIAAVANRDVGCLATKRIIIEGTEGEDDA